MCFIRAKSEQVHFLVFSNGKTCVLLGLRLKKFISWGFLVVKPVFMWAKSEQVHFLMFSSGLPVHHNPPVISGRFSTEIKLWPA